MKAPTSLASKGAALHFELAIILVTLIPMLTLCYLLRDALGGIQNTGVATWGTAVLGIVVPPLIGYSLLVRYPKTVVHLRGYLAEILTGEMPEKISLVQNEDDISAVEHSMNLILDKLKTRVEAVETENAHLTDELMQAHTLRAVGALAGGIAHEINTPLQIIRSHLDFTLMAMKSALSRGGNPEEKTSAAPDRPLGGGSVNILDELAEASREAEDAIDRIAVIMKAMKSFSSKNLSGTPVDADINEAVRNAVTISSNEWKYVAEVEMRLDPLLPSLPCYPNEIRQGLVGLIMNGAQAISEAPHRKQRQRGKICITTGHDETGIEIKVSDTGKGIPAAIRGRIFEPFFTTREFGAGSGKGLALLYSSIVNRHAGRVTFKSEENKGTTFMIRIPYNQVNTHAHAAT